ncbi:MAG: hypothetical protein ACP5N2_01865 [Candidatus Nanoarchaeia archaeon]
MSGYILKGATHAAEKWPFFSFSKSDGKLLFLEKPLSEETIKETN